MVESNVEQENSEEASASPSPKTSGPSKFTGIEEGNYRLVGWAIDTTGRRLIDEICQIAAYTPSSSYSQHIMPFSDLSAGSRRRHYLRIMNLGRYRVLKDVKSNKFVKTKSEISGLTDFIAWLEKIRDDASDGIILIYHEFNKTSSAMLLEALRRCNLIERFSKTVKGFVNGFHLAEAKCAKSTKSFSLRVMARTLLNQEDDFGNAKDRAKAAFDIAVHLSQGETAELSEDTVAAPTVSGCEEQLTDFVRPFGINVKDQEDEIAGFKVLLERQNTFRPVFGALLRATLPERRHASHLRRLLAENNIDYDKLKGVYETKSKDGLKEILTNEVANAKEKDLTELLEILDCFFDPEKKAVQPKPRFANPRKPRVRKQSGKENKDKTDNNNTTESSDVTPRSGENNANPAAPLVAPVQ